MEDCILETLAYFDIFDYPLTFSELKKYLGCKKDISDDEFREIIDSISIIQESNGFYYLIGRNAIVDKRIERGEMSIQKMVKARIISKILSRIPSIQYIGVSGSLSMNNASTTDDIDLFFITKKNTLWLTRLTVNLILITLKQKRNKLDKKAIDKICPNMFLEERSLAFPPPQRTLYTAHEIVQSKALFERESVYSQFLLKNKWIFDFFPNISRPVVRKKRKTDKKLGFVIGLIERVAYAGQKLYMGKNRSREVVTPQKALFHPIDKQKIIMEMYKLRCKQYWKLFDENLWVDKEETRFYMDEKKIRILN